MVAEKKKSTKKEKIKVVDFGEDFKSRNTEVLNMQETVDTTVPGIHTINNTKVAQIIANHQLYNRGPVNVRVTLDGQTKTLVDLSGEMEIRDISGDINNLDLVIVDAIYTLLRNGQTVMTPMLIMRTILGDCNKRMRINDEDLDWLRAEIDKMCKIRITINYEAEAIKRKIKGGEFILKSNFLQMDEVEIKLKNGDKAVAYVYNSRFAPPIYRYAEDVNQIITYPAKLLSDGRKVSTKIDVVAIKKYIIKRVRTMKNPKNKMISNRISFIREDKNTGEDVGLMPVFGLDANSKNAKHRVVKIVTECLDNLVTEGEIKGYNIYKGKNNKTIEGVEIVLN